MSQSLRPGGLTALAVVNFVLTAFAVIQVLSLVFLLLASDIPTENEVQRQQIEALREWKLVWLFLGLYGVAAILLLLSGIGFLQQKRVMGRWLGNVYALIALASVGVTTILGPEGGGFTFEVIASVVYPLLLLTLLNTTFKRDLVR